MRRILFLLLIAALFIASSAFSQVTFIGTFIDKKGVKVNGIIPILDIPGGSLAGKGEIKDGHAAIKFPLDTGKLFRGQIRLRVFGTDRERTQYSLIDPRGAAVKEQIFTFYFDPAKRTPTTQYLSGDGRIVFSSRDARSFRIDVAATATKTIIGSIATTTPSKTATPKFYPSGGTYTSARGVTISCSTSGAAIRYTTDGGTPTATTGTVYSGAFTVSNTTTLKAIAYKLNWSPSAVASVTYTIPAYDIVCTRTFLSERVWEVSTVTLNNGNIFIIYSRDYGYGLEGRCKVVDPSGSFTAGPGGDTMMSANPDDCSAVVLNNGNIVIAYSATWSEETFDEFLGAGRVDIIDLAKYDDVNSGALTFEPVFFAADVPEDEIDVFKSDESDYCNTKYYSATALDNGNALVAYRYEGIIPRYDYGTEGKGKVVIINSINSRPGIVSGPKVFNAGGTRHISTTKLNNGNVLIAYYCSGGKYVVVNPSGDPVSSAKVFSSENILDMSTARFSNGNVLIAYAGGSYKHGFFVIVEGD